MVVSVIIASIGRPASLRRLLECLVAQDFPADAFEVFVAIDGTDASSVEVLRNYLPRMAHLAWGEGESRLGPAAARNRAWRATGAPIVAMTDDDCEPEPRWLSAIVDRFQADPTVGVLVGRTVTDRSQLTPFSHYVENLGGEGHQTCNSAYRREVLEQLDGFDVRFPMAYLEDTDLYCRALGITEAVFEPAAVVYHPPREGRVRDIVRSARKYESDFIFYRKSPDLYRQRHQGRGPAYVLAWDVATKHALKQVLVHAGWLRVRPFLYLKYAAAQFLFSVGIWSRIPLYMWRHPRLGRISEHTSRGGVP